MKHRTNEPSQEAQALLAALRARFPVLAEYRPLAIGIDQALRQRCPQYSRRRLRAALGLHTGTPAYLEALARGGRRYDLDGVAVAPIAPRHREHARRLLARVPPSLDVRAGTRRLPHRFPTVLRLNGLVRKQRKT